MSLTPSENNYLDFFFSDEYEIFYQYQKDLDSALIVDALDNDEHIRMYEFEKKLFDEEEARKFAALLLSEV